MDTTGIFVQFFVQSFMGGILDGADLGILRGVLFRAFLLRSSLRAYGLEDGGHPARTIGQSFGFAGNVGFLQLCQPGDVLGRVLAHGSQNHGLWNMPEIPLGSRLPPRGHVQPHGLR